MASSLNEILVTELLLGTDADIQRGLQHLDEALRFPVAGWLRKRRPGLTPEDLAECWIDALFNLFEIARHGRFRRGPSLTALVQTLALRRATDRLRRRTADGDALGHVEATKIDDLQEHHLSVRAEPGPLDALVRADQAKRQMSLIREVIAGLPARQRTVCMEWADGYPETKSMQILRTLVTNRCGGPVTMATVKRALQEGKRKVREALEGLERDGEGEVRDGQ